jgi:transcriptional regulator with XRE-family HTH domain
MPVPNGNRQPLTIKAWREAQVMNQRTAAYALGITQGHYSKLERQVQFPGRLLAKRISARTGVPLERVLGVG